ncbi:hypothetical protein PSTG_17901, partial [Puccinia striiformis f. sp. tritici PST-78]
MTGDGLNDAPSLKAADIGVAMGITGTDVAKESSQIVLTDDNFATIVDAIEEGRNIYKNQRNGMIEFLLVVEDLTFLGLVGMIDPPRNEVKDSLVKTKKAGIDTIMITGDHLNTAVAIGQELGLIENKTQALSGNTIDDIPEESFNANINQYRVFARVSPEHKVKIVKALQSHNKVVSMTGDGVNDAPSLKAADIGVAMGITGTDVAKESSQIVLTDDNFATIVDAIEEGRNIYKNQRNGMIEFLLVVEDLTFLGLVGMIDPPRNEVKDSLVKTKKAGIDTIMITGDHLNTAVAIGQELGLIENKTQALSGNTIDDIPEESFNANINQYRVFARVSPEHKVKIVKALQSHNKVVSMTGDGVNDAPSLKAADIG